MFNVFVNVVLAAVAVVLNIWAATHHTGWMRRWFTANATLAGLYVGAYCWLLFNFDRHHRDWAEFMRPVGSMAWLIVWCCGPVVIMSNHMAKMKTVQEISETITVVSELIEK